MSYVVTSQINNKNNRDMMAFGVFIRTFLCVFFFFSFTARITELMQVLKDLNQGKYERTMVSQQERGKYECTGPYSLKFG